MDIVEEVAEAIAEIPGTPSSHEIARIAIEAYQKAIWTPAFDITNRMGMIPEIRRGRVSQLTGSIMNLIGKHLCDHGETNHHREASRTLFETLYEAGAEIITDADRAVAGLPRRGPYGLTAEEVHILEAQRTQAMLRPLPPMILENSRS